MTVTNHCLFSMYRTIIGRYGYRARNLYEFQVLVYRTNSNVTEKKTVQTDQTRIAPSTTVEIERVHPTSLSVTPHHDV